MLTSLDDVIRHVDQLKDKACEDSNWKSDLDYFLALRTAYPYLREVIISGEKVFSAANELASKLEDDNLKRLRLALYLHEVKKEVSGQLI